MFHQLGSVKQLWSRYSSTFRLLWGGLKFKNEFFRESEILNWNCRPLCGKLLLGFLLLHSPQDLPQSILLRFLILDVQAIASTQQAQRNILHEVYYCALMLGSCLLLIAVLPKRFGMRPNRTRLLAIPECPPFVMQQNGSWPSPCQIAWRSGGVCIGFQTAGGLDPIKTGHAVVILCDHFLKEYIYKSALPALPIHELPTESLAPWQRCTIWHQPGCEPQPQKKTLLLIKINDGFYFFWWVLSREGAVCTLGRL